MRVALLALVSLAPLACVEAILVEGSGNGGGGSDAASVGEGGLGGLGGMGGMGGAGGTCDLPLLTQDFLVVVTQPAEPAFVVVFEARYDASRGGHAIIPRAYDDLMTPLGEYGFATIAVTPDGMGTIDIEPTVPVDADLIVPDEATFCSLSSDVWVNVSLEGNFCNTTTLCGTQTISVVGPPPFIFDLAGEFRIYPIPDAPAPIQTGCSAATIMTTPCQ